MQKSNIQKTMAIAIMAAMGVILQFLAFPIFPAFSFLKLDFSDIPIMLNMFLFGPLAGIATALLRSVLHLFATGLEPTNIVGDVASFLASSIYILPIYYFFKGKQQGKQAKQKRIIGLAAGIIAMTIFMSIANYFVITPLYLQFYGISADQMLKMTLGKYVAIGIVPFNLIKGIIVSSVFLVLHAKLLPWLSRKQQKTATHLK